MSLVKKQEIDMLDIENVYLIKMSIEQSRREHLKGKLQQVKLRKEYLERTGRNIKWKREEQKQQLRRCNNTLRKQKINSISKVECKEQGMLVQVTTKKEVETAIMKENLLQFELACSSLLLEDNLSNDLGLSGEEHLSKGIL